MENKKYNGLTLFRNRKGGEPMCKDGSPIYNKNNEVVLIPLFNGILNIQEPLPIGEYEINIREKVSKNGNIYLWGGVKRKNESYQPTEHYQQKANGYQRESTIGLVKQPAKEIEVEDDEIPF